MNRFFKTNFIQSTYKSTFIILVILVFGFNQAKAQEQSVTLLYTNDIESVYEPLNAFWTDSLNKIGGFPYLATLIDSVRKEEKLTYLFDAGDIYTGALSQKTKGKLPIDLYGILNYDAVNIGNHEFEYGWKTLKKISPRAQFPLLNANLYYQDTDIPFGRAYAIIERQGFKIGVIGTLGIDAFKNTINPLHSKGLEVRDPVEVTQKYINLIRDEVDLIVVLTHQNKTAPMQTDKQADPEVQRGFDEDYAMAGKLEGADVIFGGHSDHGLWKPVKHPKTGTLIGLTFGQGMHLGYLKLKREKKDDNFSVTDAKLITVNADSLQPHEKTEQRINFYRNIHSDLTRKVGVLDEVAPRKYYRESKIGNLFADILRKDSKADVAIIHSGSLRADLDKGDVTVEELLNVYPFVDGYQVVELSGNELLEMVEYSLSLAYGLGQLSGVSLTYDSERPVGEKILEIKIGGKPLNPNRIYTVAAVEYLAEGGDGYRMLAEGKKVYKSEVDYSEVVIKYFEENEEVKAPALGRQIDVSSLK